MGAGMSASATRLPDACSRLFTDIAENAMHVVFHPKGLRQFITNWDEFAGQMIQILHREVAQGGRVAAQLLDEIMVYPGLPAEWRLPRNPAGSSPVMLSRGQRDRGEGARTGTLTKIRR